MAIQTINIGTNPNDGTGDDLRTAFDKVNDNFAELLAVGGETNTASNLGIGEGIFKQKTLQDLQFKTLRNNDGKITITSDANSVYLNTNNLADNDFGSIQVDNGDTLTATSSGQLFGIKGGNANISVTRSGNDIVITGAFELSNDPTPQLGGDLSILSQSIIGGVGSSITNIGSIDGGSITADTLTVNTTSGFTGTATFTGGIIANGGLTLGAGQSIAGNINGGFQGQLTGTVDTNGQTISGNGPIVIDTADINVQGVLGDEFGIGYRSKPSPFIVQTSVDLPVDLITVTGFTDVALNALNVETVVNKALSGGTSYQPGSGSTISFTINDSDGNSLGLAAIGATVVDSTVNQVALLPIETGKPPVQQPVYFTFNSSGVATLNDIEISEGGITTNVSNKNLKLDASGTGSVDFYGAYQFPRTIGNAGEVLVVPISGTELTWGAGGGGGGGSSTFVGLSDTPSSYAGAAADALKFVRVAAGGTSLEFVTVDNVIDATYIEGKGFLPKGGGTMSGDIDLGTNNITNATNITTTNLFVTTIDTTDSSAITITPGVTMNSFLTVESSLNVLDTTNTKTLTVSGNADITGNTNVGGTLTADNFQLSGGGAPSFTSGSDINFSAVGQLSTNAPLVPTTDNTVALGTASFKWSNVYATTFTGNLTGNVTGNLTGQVTGDVTGSVVADDSTPLVDGVSGKLVGPVDTSTVNATNITASANVGTDTLTFTALASGPQVTVTSKFEGPWLDVDRATVGNLAIDGNNIEAGSNDIIRLRGNGTGYIELDGNTHINGVVSYSNNEDITVSGTATPVTIDTDKQFSFITTSNWVSVGADYGYGNLANGSTEGQTKTIKMVNRGEFSTNGGATFTDRYLVVNLTINGSSGTLNVSENSEYGAVTLVWHNSSWWIVSQFDS